MKMKKMGKMVSFFLGSSRAGMGNVRPTAMATAGHGVGGHGRVREHSHSRARQPWRGLGAGAPRWLGAAAMAGYGG